MDMKILVFVSFLGALGVVGLGTFSRRIFRRFFGPLPTMKSDARYVMTDTPSYTLCTCTHARAQHASLLTFDGPCGALYCCSMSHFLTHCTVLTCDCKEFYGGGWMS